MNKELEEAIKILKRRNKILKLKYAITNEDLNAIEIILNYIDKYISKEVIEEKIEELENSQARVKNNNLIYSREDVFRFQIYILEELLEGK